MHIHILGICGTFMGGIALLARQAGHQVTGSDTHVYPPMSTQLLEQGIDLIEGYDTDQIALRPHIYVIGNAISRGNPLLEAILDQNLPYTSGPQWLAENVLQGKWVLGVAGTHGKTTTSSILAWILEAAGLNPGFLIGGVPENFGLSARATESPFFVIEADEYDTAFCDKRSKFVHYHPRTTILNNLEFDHADIFQNLAAIETQFHHLVRTLPSSGLIIANQGEDALHRVLQRGVWTPVEWFNTESAWFVQNNTDSELFSVNFANQSFGQTQLSLPGQHNRSNALAAIAAARHAGVPPKLALEALAGFRGVKRRLELFGEVRSVTIYDDFAHHPTAIAATIAALRQRVGKARILAVIEPRSNTMRLGTVKEHLAGSLKHADLVFCYAENLGWDVKHTLMPLKTKSQVFDNFDKLVQTIVASALPGDHILIMSNGGFQGIHGKLLAALASLEQN